MTASPSRDHSSAPQADEDTHDADMRALGLDPGNAGEREAYAKFRVEVRAQMQALGGDPDNAAHVGAYVEWLDEHVRDMRSLGLNPSDDGDCLRYIQFLKRESAQDIADQVVLDAIEESELVPDPSEAERIVVEAHRAADAYLTDRLDASWRLARSLSREPVVRRRAREPRTRRTNGRVRIRSGSRGDPPDEDSDPEPELVTPRGRR